jgi:hypothetical protein
MKVLNKLLSGIKGCFSHPRVRHIYAVTAGDYVGQFFVYIEKVDNSYCFLTLPDMYVRYVPTQEFEDGIDKKIVDPVEKMPLEVFNICVAQYRKSETEDK